MDISLKLLILRKILKLVVQNQSQNMKKIVFALSLLMVVALTGCGGGGPEGVAKKWCALTADIDKAEGPARDKLVEERQAFEKTTETEHKDDKAFMDKVKELIKECAK